MKAWRNIQSNNGKRPIHMPVVKGGSNWLLDGLLIHAGYLQPAHPMPKEVIPETEGLLKRASRMLRKARNYF
mgnify:CR=1 FL=1